MLQAVQESASLMDVDSQEPGQLMREGKLPVCLTCGFYGNTLSADLTAEEEDLMDCSISVCLDSSSRVIGEPMRAKMHPPKIVMELSGQVQVTKAQNLNIQTGHNRGVHSTRLHVDC